MINSISIADEINLGNEPESSIETLINNVQILNKGVKELEARKCFTEAIEVTKKVIKMIKIYIETYKSELTKEKIKWLQTLQKSYEEKINSFNYFEFINGKSLLIKQKMSEKYLGKKNLMKACDNEGMINNASNISEFEIIINNNVGPNSIIKDIIDICGSLIKYYELQISTVDVFTTERERNIKNLNLFSIKPINSYESFYVYDYQNTTLPNNIVQTPQIPIDKYIEEIKNIKLECEKLSESNYQLDMSGIKDLEKTINIIKEEIQKIYPKFQNLRDILQRNNLVKIKK